MRVISPIKKYDGEESPSYREQKKVIIKKETK